MITEQQRTEWTVAAAGVTGTGLSGTLANAVETLLRESEQVEERAAEYDRGLTRHIQQLALANRRIEKLREALRWYNETASDHGEAHRALEADDALAKEQKP